LVTLIENLRKIAVSNILETNSVKKIWPKWNLRLKKLTGNEPNATSILNLGDHLADIFKSTSESGRSQGTLKGGGVSWEGLVGWYLNLCMLGSRVVVVKMKKDIVPEPIRDALTVSYGSFLSNTESDLLAITFPNHNEYKTNLTETQKSIVEQKKLMDDLAETHFSEYELGVIQCKTNWNDNAQIPMLWDMVYHVKEFDVRNIRVGQNNYSLQDLKKFTYSFVTVPTQKNKFKKNSTPINRVSNLSGGNYWGQQTENGISRSLKEIFKNNFLGGMSSTIRDSLSLELTKLKTDYDYFRLP